MDVALVTGDRPEVAGAVDAPLRAALVERGAQVHTPWWRDPEVDWSAFDVAVVRTTWDYHHARDEFIAWAARVATSTSLWNPPDVLRWNTHKSYLLELEERGAPVVPTAWIAQGDRVELDRLLDARGWPHAVVKPAVSNGSAGLRRTTPEDPAGAQAHLEDAVAAGDVMVQPYLPSVERVGEVSVVAVDGRVTHAVRKRPAEGEFRVQRQFGGGYERLDLDADGAGPAALALWVLEATGHDVLYARVDLLAADDGTWQVAEVELTEPDLYLAVAPEVGAVLAEAIAGRR